MFILLTTKNSMTKGFLANIFNFFSELRSYDGEVVDYSKGKMLPEEVMLKVLPIAEEKGWVGNSQEVIFYAEKPCLFYYTRRKQLVWIVGFSFKTPEMTESDLNYMDNSFAKIEVDDLTGEVLKSTAFRKADDSLD
jgi:hypothetical protein